VLGQRVGEHKHEECQYADREYGDLAARDVANLGVAFSDQPAGAKKRIPKHRPMPHRTANGVSQPISPPE